MKPFAYERAATPQAAIAACGKGAKFIAGGTNLLDLMKLEIEAPDTLVDISRLDLGAIAPTTDGGLRIGAMVTNAELAAAPQIRSGYAVLARALLAGASGQLRNKATTGGNFLQRTRCYYFYNPALPCNKRDPGSGCAALTGFNRIHAILGASDHCIATHPSDMAVAMLLLDAELEIAAADGVSRRMPVAELYRLPGDTPQKDTNLADGELITAVVLPPPLTGTHIYQKVRDRASYAFALVSVAAVIEMHQGRIGAARLAFGGLAHKPWRAAEIEEVLIGEAPSRALFAVAADILLHDARGHGANDFKIPLARRTLVSVLERACQNG